MIQLPTVDVPCAISQTSRSSPPPPGLSWPLSKLKIHEIHRLAGDFFSTAKCLNYQPSHQRRMEKLRWPGRKGILFQLRSSPLLGRALKKSATRANFWRGATYGFSTVKKPAAVRERQPPTRYTRGERG